jgi:dTDP-3-amino-3,4,6-trideoxy-alpha-D-glucose transaminase
VDIPFNDLKPGTRAIRAELNAAIAEVLDSARYLLGEQGEAFEREFGTWLGVAYAVGVSSGTEAIRLALLALGVGEGDEVVTVANAGVPTVAAIVGAGARPIFVDVDPETHGMKPADLEQSVGPRTRAILPVHLYGHPADMDPILAIARNRGLAVLEDCAQAHGARYKGRLVGTLGDAAAFSFYPTKNLGAFGDAGLVATADARVAEQLRLLRNYGWRAPYVSERYALSSRLDELQAAVLRVKLHHLEEANQARRERSAWYAVALEGTPLTLPLESPWAQHAYYLYVARSHNRDTLRDDLARQGVGTSVHYPVPVHLQEPYRAYGGGPGSLPITERLAGEVVSLPLYPELSRQHVERVAATVRAATVGA